MQKFSRLRPLQEFFLDRPSIQRLMPLHKETEIIMKKSNSEIKALLSKDLGDDWQILSKAGNEEAELRSIALYTQAVAHKNVSLKSK